MQPFYQLSLKCSIIIFCIANTCVYGMYYNHNYHFYTLWKIYLAFDFFKTSFLVKKNIWQTPKSPCSSYHPISNNLREIVITASFVFLPYMSKTNRLIDYRFLCVLFSSDGEIFSIISKEEMASLISCGIYA